MNYSAVIQNRKSVRSFTEQKISYDIVQEIKTYYENLTGTKDALASLATADIAIVMDGSASMAWNDPEGKCSEVAHYFVEHMRSGYDRIAHLTEAERTALPYVMLAQQLLCTAWFATQPQYADIFQSNRRMTRLLIEHFDALQLP